MRIWLVLLGVAVAGGRQTHDFSAVKSFFGSVGDSSIKLNQMKEGTQLVSISLLEKWWEKRAKCPCEKQGNNAQSVKNRWTAAEVLIVKGSYLRALQHLKDEDHQTVVSGSVAILSAAHPVEVCGKVETSGASMAWQHEEDLCRYTTLFAAISPQFNNNFFENRGGVAITASRRLPDASVITVPDVSVFSERKIPKDDEELDRLNTVYVIQCPATDCRSSGFNEATVEVVRKKLFAQFIAAIKMGKVAVVVGPYACGQTEKPPPQLQSVYKELVDEFRWSLKWIVFAGETTHFGKNLKHRTRAVSIASPGEIDEIHLANLGLIKKYPEVADAVELMKLRVDGKWIRSLTQIFGEFSGEMSEETRPTFNFISSDPIAETLKLHALESAAAPNKRSSSVLLITPLNPNSEQWNLPDFVKKGSRKNGTVSADPLLARTLVTSAFSAGEVAAAVSQSPEPSSLSNAGRRRRILRVPMKTDLPYIFVDNVPIVRDTELRILPEIQSPLAILLSQPWTGPNLLQFLKGAFVAAAEEKRTVLVVAPFLSGDYYLTAAMGFDDFAKRGRRSRKRSQKRIRQTLIEGDKAFSLGVAFAEALKFYRGHFELVIFAIERKDLLQKFRMGFIRGEQQIRRRKNRVFQESKRKEGID